MDDETAEVSAMTTSPFGGEWFIEPVTLSDPVIQKQTPTQNEAIPENERLVPVRTLVQGEILILNDILDQSEQGLQNLNSNKADIHASGRRARSIKEDKRSLGVCYSNHFGVTTEQAYLA